jgi:hypothetical protein
MKKWMFSLMMVLMMILSACTPRIYGVPEDRWETMSRQERVAAMEAYKARQEALRQQREERARLRAMEKEAQLAREAEEDRRRQMRVDAIYRGEGLYGELLRVTLEGGMLQFHGVHKPFHPVSFRIAAGEIKDVEVVSVPGRKARMAVSYDGGNLLLDETPKSRHSNAIRLPYEDSWETGATYPHLVAKGPLEIRGVDVTVQVIGKPPRGRHDRRQRHPAAVQPPVRMPQRPAVVVVKEPARHPRPAVVVVKEPARHPRPAVVVVKEPHRHPKPEVVVVDRGPQTKVPDVVAVKPHPGADKYSKIKTHGTHKRKVAAAAPARIKVVFRKGHFTAEKRSCPMEPQTIVLRDGQTRDIFVRGRKGKLKIRVGYVGGELLIDDVPGKNRRCTRLGYVPGWKDGRVYAVAASGNGRLKDLDILIISQ